MAEMKPAATKSEWRICLECGNRYVAGKARYQRNWCSPRCQAAFIKSQRTRLFGGNTLRSMLR